mgnify:FL=1
MTTKKKKIVAGVLFGCGCIIIGIAYVYSWKDVARQLSQIQVDPPTEDVQEFQTQLQEIQASFDAISTDIESETDESQQTEDQLSPFERAMQDVE